MLKISPSTIFTRFKLWVQRGILEKVWGHLLKEYSDTKLKTDPHHFKELFIDSSMIKNIAGKDCLGKNPTDRGRNASKLSIICDSAQIPISACFYPANKTDVTTTMETVELIKCRIRRDNRYCNTLVGDKGYISKGIAAALKEKRIKLLTPTKKNAKIKPILTVQQKCALHRRHRVENFFCRLDKFKRLLMRHDRCISSFQSFHFLAFAVIVSRQLGREPLSLKVA
jgi:putative transposase